MTEAKDDLQLPASEQPWGLCVCVAGETFTTAFAGTSDGYLRAFDIGGDPANLFCEKVGGEGDADFESS